PTIEFTRLPAAGEGSAEKVEPIAGRVKGAQRNDRIVLYARSGPWWVQPLWSTPFTALAADSTWRNHTHPGTAYAALLVQPGYRPQPTLDTLPEAGGAVRAVVAVDGTKLPRATVKSIQFSGYEWQIRQSASDPGGTRNHYDPSNAWTD